MLRQHKYDVKCTFQQQRSAGYKNNNMGGTVYVIRKINKYGLMRFGLCNLSIWVKIERQTKARQKICSHQKLFTIYIMLKKNLTSGLI
jgi:hypothetical protein